MEWKLSEEQQSYQESLRGWLANRASPAAVREWWDAGDLSAFDQRLREDGWWGVGIAEDAGGQGGGVVELALTAEELGRAAAPDSAWLASLLTVPATRQLAGVPACWLSPADGPPATVDLAMDGQGRLSGTVPRVLAGAESAVYVVALERDGVVELRCIDEDRTSAITDARGLLDRTRGLADVTLADVSSRPLDGDGTLALASAGSLAAVLVAADSLGTTERMLEMAVGYSLQRKQFGVAVGSFQAVKHAAATIEVGVEAARSAVYFAAASLDSGGAEAFLHAAAVKAQVTAEGSRAADTALTMHGAIGYTWEHDLHLFYKRAKLDEHLFGSPHWWNEQVADGLALA
jgi:alkylation response protein AidB-like acyl-CoA dehydrogenase